MPESRSLFAGLSWWYAAPAIFGGVQLVALPLLIPAYVIELTGSAAQSGGALAMIGAAGFVAPLIGGLADRRAWHAAMQLIAVLAYGLGFALLAFVPFIAAVYAATALIGLGSITLLSINPTFIVAANYGESEKALRLTRMNQAIFIGAIITGALLALAADFGKQGGFILMVLLALIALGLTAVDNRAAAARMQDASAPDRAEGGQLSLGFVIFLLAVFIGMMASANQIAQGPNVLENVFAVEPAWISTMLTLSALLSLLTLDFGGRLMERADAGAIWVLGLGIYLLSSGGMALLWYSGADLALLALLLQLLFMQGLSLVDMAKPALAVRASNLAPSTTQGVLLFAIAGGYAIGTVSGGQVAERASLAALPAFAAAMALLSLILALLWWRSTRDR